MRLDSGHLLRSSLRTGYVVSFVGCLALIAVFIFQESYASVYEVMTDALIDITAGVALASAGATMTRYQTGLGTRSGQVWSMFTGGILLWFLGEVTWSVYYDVLNVSVPYPSVADAFYLSGYIPLFAGFYFYVTYFRPAISRRVVLGVLGAILASAAVVLILLVEPVLTTSEEPLARFFDFAYPLLDLALLSLALLGLGLLVRGRLGIAWFFFNVGILLNVLGDLIFTYTTAQGTYYVGSLPDLFFMQGYVSFALAFYLHRKEL
jgi:hypothetical protein